jgi:hypothetical protein
MAFAAAVATSGSSPVAVGTCERGDIDEMSFRTADRQRLELSYPQSMRSTHVGELS